MPGCYTRLTMRSALQKLPLPTTKITRNVTKELSPNGSRSVYGRKTVACTAAALHTASPVWSLHVKTCTSDIVTGTNPHDQCIKHVNPCRRVPSVASRPIRLEWYCHAGALHKAHHALCSPEVILADHKDHKECNKRAFSEWIS